MLINICFHMLNYFPQNKFLIHNKLMNTNPFD
nr:MAG TPA: hypothetical protein [Caudoviricetes sp.]